MDTKRVLVATGQWPYQGQRSSDMVLVVAGCGASGGLDQSWWPVARLPSRPPPQGWLPHHTVKNIVTTMASKQVTITVDEGLLAWFEQKAAQTGSKLSPTIAKAARNWLLWEDAARLAEADRRIGRDTLEHAEAELAVQREAEATEADQGHAA